MGDGLGLIPTILMIAANTMTSYKQQQKQEKAQEKSEARAYARWQEASKPDPAALEAMATQNRGQLAQARLGSYQNLASNLASRGFGAGSGLAAREAGQIESGYLQGLGQMGTELTKYATTPMFGPPSSIYAQPMTGATSAAVGTAQSGLNQAAGYYTTMNEYNQGNWQNNPYAYSSEYPSKW